MKKNKVLHIVLNPVFVILFLLMLFTISAFHLNTNYDESLWMYIGSLWSDKGIPPYLGAVENKTPGIFVLFAISNYLTSSSLFFVRALGVIATLLTCFFLYAICKKIYNKVSAVICLYVFGLITCWQSMDGFAFAHTEVFMVLLSTMAFYFLIRFKNFQEHFKWVLFAGLSMGLAIAFKQIAITTACTLGIVLLIFGRGKSFLLQIKGLLILVFGISITTFLSYLVLYFYGVSFYEYIEGAWLILFNTGSKVTSITEHFNNFISKLIVSRFVLFYPLVIWFLLKKNIINHPYKIVLGVWLLLDFIGVNASGYYFGHQLKQILPVFSIITAISISFLISKKHKEDNNSIYTRAAQIILMIGAVCFPYKQLYHNFKLVLEHNSTLVLPHVEIANWIQKNSSNDDYIYIIGGEPNLIRTQAIAKRASSSKHFQSIFITSDYERDVLLEDLKEKPPIFILRDQFIDKDILKKYGKKVRTFVNNNYVLLKTMHEVEILQKRKF
ncbi:ArnT family glycosyltransferase [Pontimicrobium aquaticum]|nr:glycosyltransferase family 39 protein [Pontimicrobium aquaticum]